MTTLQLTTAQVDALAAGVPVVLPEPPEALTLVPPTAQPTGAFQFRPTPPGWKVALQEDFTAAGASLASLNDWAYGGRPGGAQGCEWVPERLSFVAGKGMRIETGWDATRNEWTSAGVGTHASFPTPRRTRWYDVLMSANIEGHNMLDIEWCNPWIEEGDTTERSVHNGLWLPSTFRIHNGTSANVIPPLTDPTGPSLGVLYCNESEYSVVNGVPTATRYVDGVTIGSRVIPAADWATMLQHPHWIGVQNELYAIGTGDKTKTDVRFVCGIEVLVPA